MSDTANERNDFENNQIRATIANLTTATAKFVAETARINKEASSYPWLPLAASLFGSTGLIGAIVAVIIALHK